jgi:hypothetical protein
MDLRAPVARRRRSILRSDTDFTHGHAAAKTQRFLRFTDARPPADADDHAMGRDGDLHERDGLDTSSCVPARRTEQRCAECCYGVVLAGSPPRCPLCGSTTWTTTTRPMWAEQEVRGVGKPDAAGPRRGRA